MIYFFEGSTGECELAVVSSPPVSRKPHYAKEVSSDQLLNLRYAYTLFTFYLFTYFICLHFILLTFSEVNPKLTVVVTKCDQFPRHNYVKLICNQPRLLLLARQGTIHTYIFIFLFAFINLCFCLHHCLFTICTLGWDFAGLHNK